MIENWILYNRDTGFLKVIQYLTSMCMYYFGVLTDDIDGNLGMAEFQHYF
jgi:hypothetical protein